jgi:hypothetical protein
MHLVVHAIRVIGETHAYLGGGLGGVLGYMAFQPQCSLNNVLVGGSVECHNWFGPTDSNSEWFWPLVAASIVAGCAIQAGLVSAFRKR